MEKYKFRAWDKKEKKMVWLFSISSSGEFINNKGITQLNDRYIVMQYTGLKDKNGKMIFEGDIVNDTEVVWKERVSVQWNSNGKYYVSGWFIRFKEEDNKYYTYFPLEEGGEIIGNIYEDENLLK